MKINRLALKRKVRKVYLEHFKRKKISNIYLIIIEYITKSLLRNVLKRIRNLNLIISTHDNLLILLFCYVIYLIHLVNLVNSHFSWVLGE